MPIRHRRNSRFVFRLLAAYILFQFVWWAYHIVQLHGVIKSMELAAAPSPEYEAINRAYANKVWMVLGEGAVFVALLLFGMWRMGLYLRKEAELARRERNFLLAVTHELKTPVASLRLFLETLRTRRQLPEEQRDRLVGDALGETNRLDHLVENILLSTRFELEQAIHREPLNLSQLVHHVSEKLSRTVGQEHCFVVSVTPNLGLDGDASMLESLLTNLVDNAVKYAPKGSQVTIALNNERQRARLTVRDEGCGIPVSEHTNIFSKFYRVGNEETRRSKGTGLGLYLVHRIAMLHQGAVGIEPVDGVGSLFCVEFPLTDYSDILTQ